MFTKQFGTRALFRDAGAAARFAAPIVGTRVFTFGQAMLVMVLLARESPADMASLSLAAAVGQVLVMLGFGALIGTQTEIARLHGPALHRGSQTTDQRAEGHDDR